MLLTNETSSLHVQLFSTNDEQMLCISSMRLWLLSHSYVTLLIHLFFFNFYCICLFLCMIFFLLSPSFRNFVDVFKKFIQIWSYQEGHKYLYGIILLMKQMILIFVCFLIAFLYKWIGMVHNNHSITSMDFWR